MKTLSLPDIQKQMATLAVTERYFESAVLFALFEVGVFEELATGPKTFAELDARVRGDSESLRAALDAGVALKVVRKKADRYSADEAFLDCLGRKDSPAYVGEWVRYMHALAPPLLRLGEEIRTGSKPGVEFENLTGDTLQSRLMTQAMNAYARTRGIEIADRLDFSKTRRLLDLACGPGTYSLAILERHPHVHATLLDLPGPIAEARRLIGDHPLSERLTFVAADGLSYVPEQPFDTILISNVLFMLGLEGAQALLRHCHDTLLSPGGRLILQAQFLNDDRTSPRWPTLLAMIQRVTMRQGRNHAVGETTEWMKRAGFDKVDYVRFSVWNVCTCLIGWKS
jgi:hypothetical protein